jgi:hypothetical protein
VTNTNGAGWILAKGTVSSNKEWHFFFHDRDNNPELGFELKGEKKLTDKNGSAISYEDKHFKFNIYNEGPDGKETGNLIYTTTADSEGKIRFARIKYTNRDVPKGTEKQFKYVVKEDTEGCTEKDGKYFKDGIEYTPTLIHIVIDTKNFTTNDNQPVISVKMTVDGKKIDGGLEAVFEIGNFVNKKSEDTVKNFCKKSVVTCSP